MRWPIALLLFVVTACGCGRERAHAGETDAPISDAERAAYDRYRRPDLLIAALGLRAGDAVADVGAGRGYLTHRLAAAVGPGGRLLATDIDAAALGAIGPAAAGEAPIETRLVRPADPGLETAAYDLVLLAQVDHLLADRADYLARVARALRPGGRIAVSNRPPYRAALLAAAARAGLAVAAESHDLPAHFLVVLEAR